MFPLNIHIQKLGLQLVAPTLGWAGNGGTDLELPTLAGALNAVNPGNLPYGDPLVTNDLIDPQALARGAVFPLDKNGDGLAAVSDGIAVGNGGDAPVGVVVAADGREARAAVKVLDAGLDPLCGRGAGLGEAQEDAGLVELLGVGGGEGYRRGDEAEEGVAGVWLVGSWV